VKHTTITESPEATRALGAALGQALATSSFTQPLVVALNGELGAGKTTFVSGLLRALGVVGPVRSPTYTLIETYELGFKSGSRLYHLDLYRLADSSELEMLAPRDLLEPGAVLLVEWAERGSRVLPSPDLSLTFRYPPAATNSAAATQRVVEIESGSSAGDVLALNLHQISDEQRLSP